MDHTTQTDSLPVTSPFSTTSPESDISSETSTQTSHEISDFPSETPATNVNTQTDSPSISDDVTSSSYPSPTITDISNVTYPVTDSSGKMLTS